MFTEKFDDFQRKLNAKPADEFPWTIQFRMSCMKGTPVFDEWIEKFMAPDSDLHMSIEPDNNYFTFYAIVPRVEKEESHAGNNS